jgi:hypothetical protein
VARFPRQSEGTDFEAACSENKSVRYGFGTTTFIVSVLGVQQLVFQGKRAHLLSRTGRTAVVQQQQKSGHVFSTVRTVRTVRLSVHRFRGG